MDYIPFNSRLSCHKSVFGALKSNEKVEFRVIMPRDMRVEYVNLVLKTDEKEKKIPFSWEKMQGENEEWWHLCTFFEPGLYFYFFEYTTAFGTGKIMRKEGGIGLLDGADEMWQLTVFKNDFVVPSWLKGGVIYQIFPDRFNKSKEPKAIFDRKIHQNTADNPDFLPDENGKILNNDFFGGDLKGIEEKLPYLKSLGVTCIYLNPIFFAHSNHRYDTADYMKIDPMLGDENDFKSLCDHAKKFGIKIIFDGVFSHTGDDSRYFNKYHSFDDLGAFESKDSKYYKWYKFSEWPNKYDSWWGIDILPETDEENDEFIEFITGDNGVLKKWLSLGASGVRLDVADELPDKFLDRLRKKVKEFDENAIIIGEVWEDASNKISYSHRRRYLLGDQLDSVMNYPFSDAIISFIESGIVEGFGEKIMTVLEHYPKDVVDSLFNLVGTHDTKRILTSLCGESDLGRDRVFKSKTHLSEDQLKKGKKLLKLASLLEFTLPGVPCIYYGDEILTEGYGDPFNRTFMRWDSPCEEILSWYKSLGKMRSENEVFKSGSFSVLSEKLGCLAFLRECENESILVIINRNEHEIDYILPAFWQEKESILGNSPTGSSVKIEALGAVVLKSTENF